MQHNTVDEIDRGHGGLEIQVEAISTFNDLLLTLNTVDATSMYTSLPFNCYTDICDNGTHLTVTNNPSGLDQ